jgi:hypothetical protein
MSQHAGTMERAQPFDKLSVAEDRRCHYFELRPDLESAVITMVITLLVCTLVHSEVLPMHVLIIIGCG